MFTCYLNFVRHLYSPLHSYFFVFILRNFKRNYVLSTRKQFAYSSKCMANFSLFLYSVPIACYSRIKMFVGTLECNQIQEQRELIFLNGTENKNIYIIFAGGQLSHTNNWIQGLIPARVLTTDSHSDSKAND